MIKVFKIALETGLINPIRLIRFFYYFIQTGPNLFLLLRYSQSRFPKVSCIIDDEAAISYEDFYCECSHLAVYLEEKYTKTGKNKVGMISRNSINNLKLLFSLSRTGADLFLLNADLNSSQLLNLINKLNLDLVILDTILMDSNLQLESESVLFITEAQLLKDFYHFSKNVKKWNKIAPRRSGELVVLTGGTTGNSKEVRSKPNMFTFLNPLYALLAIVKINRYKTVYVPLPIYHGFGLGAVITSIFIGKTVYLSKKFKTTAAIDLIKKNKIEVITLVPVMLQRIIDFSDDLKSVKCIITGGAPISIPLVVSTNTRLKNRLYNLYGTSEAGFCLLATPEDLTITPETIGKPIYGVKVKLDKTILNNRKGEGELLIRNNWTVTKNSWIHTGDVGYQNEKGYFVLNGRIDNMIVSGGENVFPEDLERILLQHFAVKEAAVIGINDDEFGQRLKAFVVIREDSNINEDELLQWVKNQAAKFQIPRSITIMHEMPYTSIGKINKRELKSKN